MIQYLKELSWPLTRPELKEKLMDSNQALDNVDVFIDESIVNEDIIVVGDKLYYIDQKDYTVGVFRVVREQFAFVENEDESYYVAKEDFNQALDLDKVLISIHHRDGRTHGKIISIVKHGREYILGTIEKQKGKIEFIPYDRKILLPIKFKDDKSVKIGDRVIGKIISFGKEINVEITSVLGQKDEPGMDVLSVLFVYGIDSDFSKEALEEAKRIPQVVLEEDLQGRTDHRSQMVITIDGEDAKDLDDAIYMESLNNGFRLYVHIADVSHYVPQGSMLDREAYKRSSSVYMVDRVVPMLPKSLSNGICSLHPHVDRLTLTCQMDIDLKGEMIDYHVYPSVIHSSRRFSYNEVNAERDLGEYEDMLAMMFECARRLEYRRNQAGSIDFDTDESQFLVDENGKILDVFRRERGEAQRMIESFMICANEAVALTTKYMNIPALYRVHEKPDKEKLQDLSHTLRILGYRMKGSLDNVHPKLLQSALRYFKDKPEYPIVSRLTLRSMSKARYSEEALGHFGLALDDYTHFTSPIRRYPDLLLHQRLRTYLFKSDSSHLKEDENFAIDAGIYVSRKERAILDAERQVERMKKCEFMKEKIGEKYVGYISGISNFGIYVELPNTVEGMVALHSLKDDYYNFDAVAQKLTGERTKRVYNIGQKVQVKVIDVDEVEYTVLFEFIRPKREVYHRVRNRKKSKGVS